MRSAAVGARPRPAAAAVAPAAVVVLASACWIVAARRMDGMDMGTATELGPLGSFVATWAPMMAAMMLPGAVPAIAGRARAGAGSAIAFAAAYLAVWAAAGLAVHALYRPHATLVAGAVTAAAGLYELTPLKRDCRRRCRGSVGSGFEYGLNCVGSSIGLMVILLALGVMSVTWMVVIAALVLAQKLLAPRTSVDVPVAVAIVGLGLLIAVTPSSVPGLVLPM
jgi:predicted metal-binding membrane protein